MKTVFPKSEAKQFTKAGVSMWVYSDKTDCPYGGFVYQEVTGGHFEEFYNKKSAFLYYIIEGNGEYIVEEQHYPVKATDVIIIPPGKRFYYKGTMKQLLATAPAWEESEEVIVRQVPRNNSMLQ